MARQYETLESAQPTSNLDEATLWELYIRTRDENGDVGELRELLVDNYMILVYQTAERVGKRVPSHIDIQDLISSGAIGLLDAIDNFDPTRGIKFSTYCNPRIYGAIIDEFRRLDWAPRLVRHRASQLERAREDLESELGRPASDDELAEKMGRTPEEFDDLLKETQVRTMVSLDRKWDENDDHEMGPMEMMPDTRAADPLSELARAELKEVAMRGLSECQKKVLVLYYYENLNLKEIGAVLNLSESRVCQIHNQIITFLRHKFSQRHIAPTLD